MLEAEKTLLEQRQALEELNKKIAGLEEQLKLNELHQALMAAYEARKVLNKTAEEARKKYAEIVLMKAAQLDFPEGRHDFAPRVKIINQRDILLAENHIFDVLHWIKDKGFWEQMVSIKTHGMVGKLEKHLPATDAENKLLIWVNHGYAARVDGGLWAIENNDKNGSKT